MSLVWDACICHTYPSVLHDNRQREPDALRTRNTRIEPVGSGGGGHRSSLDSTSSSFSPLAKTPAASTNRRSLVYHTFLLAAVFVGIVLSGYLLPNAASNLVDAFGISEAFGGVVILSIATIPEISGNRRPTRWMDCSEPEGIA